MASRHTTGPTIQIALTGPPNAGKSSLFNALVARRGGGRQRSPALVSSERGTTRDYLTATIELDGLRCDLVDTAGVERYGIEEVAASRHPSEQAPAIDLTAQALTRTQHAKAAIRACCVDASQDITADTPGNDDCDVIVLTKADIAPQAARIASVLPANVPVVFTSSRTGEGLDELCAAVRELLTNESATHPGQVVAATADRCRESIRLAESAVRQASEIAEAQHGDELLAAELRTALSEIGKVVGAVYTEDLLDRIFSTFCIGK